MLNAMPAVVTLLCTVAALLSVAAASLMVAYTVRHGTATNRALQLLRECCGLGFFLLWSIFLLLASADLTFERTMTLILRWITLIYPLSCLLLALTEHEFILLVPGMFAVLTLPFFETAFGTVFPYELMAMLVLMLAELVIRLIRGLRQLPWQMDLRSVQEAVDGLDDGLLFADESGRILLCNRTIDDLAVSLCHQPLRNANEFWQGLEAAESTEFITKIASENSFLFRFGGGNIWTLHREQLPVGKNVCTQIVALNVTESDRVQRQILVRRAEVARVAEQLQQVQSTIAQLKEEQSRVDRGNQNFDSITEKMAALNRFFSEHYALPAETFDYKRLAVLTAKLLEELEHASPMTASQQLELTKSAFGLLNIPIAVEGELPEREEIAAAFLQVIREASINAVSHGKATAITVTMEETEQEYRCLVKNNGAPLTDALVPGGGITGIRRTLFPLNGQLEITREPEFSLLAKIPRTQE